MCTVSVLLDADRNMPSMLKANEEMLTHLEGKRKTFRQLPTSLRISTQNENELIWRERGRWLALRSPAKVAQLWRVSRTVRRRDTKPFLGGRG